MSSPPPSRRRRVLGAVGLVATFALIALLAAAVIPASHAATSGRGRARATVAPANNGQDQITARRVFDSAVSARSYGTLAAEYDQGVTRSGQLLSQTTPVSGSQFRRPFHEYKRYAERCAVHLHAASESLTAALRTGDRATARRRWALAFSDYLHLGAVYGFLPGDLNDALAEVPPSQGTSRFPGLHRIEKGLWTGQSVRSLVTVGVGVERATVRLVRIVPGLSETPLEYSLRAHEILEDAQRDLMSGLDVPWSGAGVLGTHAALVADEKEVSTLVPLLSGQGNTLGSAQYWLRRLNDALLSVRRAHRGWPPLARLTLHEREEIDGSLAGTLAVTADIPDELDTYVPSIPAMPTATKRGAK